MSDGTLFVVLGAGASKGCSAPSSIRGEAIEPPLTRDLFHPRFDSILAKYPLLHGAVPEIRSAMDGDAVSLEDFLRESYRDSADPLHQRVARTIPLYLQHLLQMTSSGWTVRPDWYDLLVHQSLRRFTRVIFVTLNYDILLDKSLHGISPLQTLDDFISTSEEKRWALVKLHGSITWSRKVNSAPYRPDSVPADLSVGEEIHHRWTEILENMRVWEEPHYMGQSYPALSTPFGSEDDLNCPDEHVEFLSEALREEGLVEMLVIGYSGLDKALLRILLKTGISLKHVTVVDINRDAAEAALGRIGAEVEILDSEPMVDRFEVFASSGSLTSFLQRRSEAP